MSTARRLRVDLRDPCGDSGSGADSDDGDRIAESGRDVRRFVGEISESLGGDVGQTADVAAAFGMVWKAWNVDVVALRVERVGELSELARRVGESVKQHDGARRADDRA